MCQGLHVTGPSKPRALYNCIFGGGDRIWSTNKALTCMHVHQCGRSPATRLSMARLGVYFAPKWLGPFYDLTTDEEATTAFVFWSRLEIHVGSGPD